MKYVLKRILKMNYKNFFSVINKIKKETKKSKLVVFFDLVFTCLKYKAGYMDYFLLKMYDMTEKEKSTYLVRGKNNELVEKLNKNTDIHLLNNKIETNKILNKYLKRDWSYLEDPDLDIFLKSHQRFIAKPSNGQCGKGIEIIDSKKFNNKAAMISYLKNKSLDLLEELILQHKELNKINNSSVNTLRIVSIYNSKLFLLVLV
jgi:glutathione synthase/RimK-type ligase-like ATP-grasp enzyme